MAKKTPIHFDIITIFPEMLEPYLQGSILGRGQKAGVLKIQTHQLRQWTTDRHQTVDDKPYGGGPGMVMKVEPFHQALRALGLRKKNGTKTILGQKSRVILTSAKGKFFTQQDAERLSHYKNLVFLCGRYEGVDERVATHLADEELSIGPFVLTGGELAALVMCDAIARLQPGVLGKAASLETESHTEPRILEHPQYTRPEIYKPTKGVAWRVPETLISGHHQKIEAWRKINSNKLDENL